ncbi:MAG: hypothetical protein MK108_17140 [Mariniblastus sp.]|nr:hypothetical protein [Mariniblastus sp.]
MKLHLSLIVFVLLLTLHVNADADVVIDRFDVGNSGSVPRAFETVDTYSVFTSTDTSILGGVRKWQVEVTKHSIAQTDVYDVASGMYSVSNGFGQNAITTIRWDGMANDLMSGRFDRRFGGGRIDLTDGGTNSLFSLDVLFADVTTQFEVVVTDADGTFGVAKVVTQPEETEFLFSEFTGIDFSEVLSIELVISGQDGFDVGINHFAAVAIPEPFSTSFWGTGLIALWAGRRRR